MGAGGGAGQAGVAGGGAGTLAASMREPSTRIFSDLHFRDPQGVLKEMAEFAPLLGDAGRVVFNGDSLDTQIGAMARHGDELKAFGARLEREGREVTWLTGNHDPDFGEEAELSLQEERVWVTHGDVFFHAIAPWSHYAGELRAGFERLATGVPAAELGRVETRLRLHREVVRTLREPEHLFHPGVWARAYRLAHTVLPPRRVVEMIRAWCATPRLVAELARAQRPRAQVVVLGHTHYPGVWRVPARGAAGRALTVINTGSFTRPLGGLFVELRGERVRVVRISRGAGGFRAERVVAEFALEK
jgi:predicted phosphodiesterase